MTVGLDTGAVAGRVFVKGGFGFDGAAVAMVCLLRDGTRRGAAVVIGIEILMGRGGFFFSSDDSLAAGGGFIASRGFLSAGFVALEGTDSMSSRFIGCDIFFVGAGRWTIATGAVDRTSPRRLSSTDFSAYSLILFNLRSSMSVRLGRMCFSPRHFHSMPRHSNALSRTLGSASPVFLIRGVK